MRCDRGRPCSKPCRFADWVWSGGENQSSRTGWSACLPSSPPSPRALHARCRHGLEDNDMRLCRRLLLCVALGVRARSWHVGAFPGNWRRAGGHEVSHPEQPLVSRALTRPPKTRKERVKNRRRGCCAPGCHIHPTKSFIKRDKSLTFSNFLRPSGPKI